MRKGTLEDRWHWCDEVLRLVDDDNFPHSRRLNALLAVAWAGMVWDVLNAQQRTDVLLAERAADGGSTVARLRTREKFLMARAARNATDPYQPKPWIPIHVLRAGLPGGEHTVEYTGSLYQTAWLCESARFGYHVNPPDHELLNSGARAPFLAEQVHLLHDLHPTMMHRKNPPARGPWAHEREVRMLASAIYDCRDWAAMPVLGDVLEEAGCELPAALEHCRHHPRHTRGCWVVDLVLGK